MSLVDCGSVDVSAVAPISVDLSKFSGVGSNPCEVKLQNESPLTLQVNIGGDQHRLGAWTVDKFPLCGKTNFQVVPTQIQSPAPAGVPSNLLYITVAPDGETIPGTFPAPLARMTTGTVILGSGSATVGSINAVLSTVTVAGTINIGNTPTVVIGAGSAAIGTINIGNTPTVVIGAGSAAIGSVTIASGTITIANASIGVINAAGTKITSSRPPQLLGTVTSNPNPNSVNFAIPVDIQAIVVVLGNPLGQYVHIALQYLGPVSAVDFVPLNLWAFPQQIYVVPVLPKAFDEGNNSTSTIQTTVQATGLTTTVAVWAIFESAPEWLTLFPQPQLEPNQFPLFALPSLVNGVAQWLIAPVTNVQITLFSINLFWANADTTRPLYVGHNPTLPGAGLTPNPIFAQLTPGPPAWDLHGAQLPRGSGLYIEQLNGATLAAAVTIICSLS